MVEYAWFGAAIYVQYHYMFGFPDSARRWYISVRGEDIDTPSLVSLAVFVFFSFQMSLRSIPGDLQRCDIFAINIDLGV